jgi:hypothetical protein
LGPGSSLRLRLAKKKEKGQKEERKKRVTRESK